MSLEEMQEQIERYYINMENELLMNIAKKLEMGKPMEIDKFDTEKGEKIVGSGGVNEWQLERLKELGGLTEENAKIIAKYSNKTIEDVNAIFERAREIGTEVDKEILGLGIKAGILNEINPVVEDIVVRKILNNSINEVLTTFNKQNNSLLASAGNEYKEIVNRVSSQVMAGTKTTMKAMQEAVSKLAEKGLTGFTTRNGAQWSPEAYTKMVIRSNTQNTINHIQDERMQLAGNDYIEVSSHIGARPLCSQDQGKIFSLSGNTAPIQDGSGLEIIPKPWSSSTYGEPAGIFGINCGHSRYAFVPGLSYKREMDFTKKENDEAYIEKQQQRLYERTIRNKKREIAMLKEIGAEDDYISIKTNKLKSYQKEYLNFLDKTGRTRIRENEWIGSNKLTQQKNKTESVLYNKWIKKKNDEENLLKNAKKVYNNVDNKTAIKAYKQLMSRNKKLENNKELLIINKNKQNKHNINSKSYIKGKSYFVIDLNEEQELVYKYATKGYTPLTNSGNIQNKEICTIDKAIGVYINNNYNIKEETNSFVIHYSTTGKGVHIVPASNDSQIKIEKGDVDDK